MKDPIKLKELVLDKLSLAELMLAYNVEFIYDPRKADEAQFRCPFHGKDNKPSARLYNATKSCFCWVCRKRWDAISFIMDMEHLSFVESIKYLINRYKIDTTSIPDDPEWKKYENTVSDINVRMLALKSNIISFRKKLPFEKYKSLCSAYFMILYSESLGQDITPGLDKIEAKILCLKK